MQRAYAAVVTLSVVACSSRGFAASAPIIVAPPTIVTAPRLFETHPLPLIGARFVTAQDIARSRATTLTELLHSLPELRSRELPGSPNPQIDGRGLGDQNTLVLLDGVRMREYEQLTVNWSSIPLASVARIEILPASGAVLFGGGASGGTINIVTRRPSTGSRSAYLGGTAASHATLGAQGGGAIAEDGVALRVHGSHYETANYRDNNAARIDSAQADLRWTRAASTLLLKLGADDQRNALPGVISEAQIAVNRRRSGTLGDFTAQRGGHVHLSAQTPLGSGSVEATLGYRIRDTDSSFLVGTPLRNNVDTQVRLWSFTPRLRLAPNIGNWENSLVLGADYEDWTFDSVAGPFVIGRPHSTQRSTGLSLQHQLSFATHSRLTLGVREQRARYDVIDRARTGIGGARSHDLRAWEASVQRAVGPDLDVHARMGASFRVPNVNDNYNPFLGSVTLLEPQTARELELGLAGTGSALRFRVALYRMALDNEIFFDPVTLGSRNRQPNRRQGLELDARWGMSASLELHVGYVYADATFRAGLAGNVPIAGNQVPLSPRHRLHAGVRWAVSPDTRINFDVRHVSSSIFDADERNTFGREIPKYTIADLKLTMQQGEWLIAGGVRNLFDKEYFTYGVVTGRPTYAAFPASERTLFVSAQHSFH